LHAAHQLACRESRSPTKMAKGNDEISTFQRLDCHNMWPGLD
jgi:hypothetical protein